MTPRSFVVAASTLVLLAVAGLAIIALAFMRGGEATSETAVVAASPTPTLPPPTIEPTLEPQPPTAPTPTTIGAGVKPTFTPAPPTTPTPWPPTPTPEPPMPPGGPPSGPPGTTESPVPTLPDLVVLNLVVSGDRVSAVVGNVGGKLVPGGTTIQIALRGALAASNTLSQGLGPGGSFTMLLAQEFVYQPGSVTALVDPNNLVPEANEANNSLTRHLVPDMPIDLAIVGLGAVGADEHLSVTVRNNSPVPVRGVTARLSVFRTDSSSPLSVTNHSLNIEAQGTLALDSAAAAVRGLPLRVVLELAGVADGNPANNTLEATVP